MLSTEPRALLQCAKPVEFCLPASDGLQILFHAGSGEIRGAN
jgi:hypothetical protein